MFAVEYHDLGNPELAFQPISISIRNLIFLLARLGGVVGWHAQVPADLFRHFHLYAAGQWGGLGSWLLPGQLGGFRKV